MAEIAASIIRAVNESSPTLSTANRMNLTRFAYEVEHAAHVTESEAAGVINPDEARRLAQSKSLIGAGAAAEPALRHVLNVLANPAVTRQGVQLQMSDASREVLSRGGVAAPVASTDAPNATPQVFRYLAGLWNSIPSSQEVLRKINY